MISIVAVQVYIPISNEGVNLVFLILVVSKQITGLKITMYN